MIEELIKSGHLWPYKACLFDSWCWEPVSWWYPILKHLWDDLWQEVSKLGKMECCYPKWFLITKSLTRQEAIEKYGEQKEIERWPRWWFKTITFWEKKFCLPELAK